MSVKLIMATVLTAVLGLASGSPAFAQARVDPGGPPAGGTPSVLPHPDFHFPGLVGRTVLDSDKGQFPQPVKAQGAGSAEVEASYLKARELVDRLGDESRRFPVLWGLWFVNYSRGSYGAAREAGQRLLDVARSGNDTEQLLEAHHALWPTFSAMGCAYAPGGSAFERAEEQMHAAGGKPLIRKRMLGREVFRHHVECLPDLLKRNLMLPSERVEDVRFDQVQE